MILDIRHEAHEHSILDDIYKGLHPADSDGGEKRLPTLLLYDEAGLKLFEKITYLDEYYLTNAEIEVLAGYARRIAERIPAGSLLVELGSGNLRKILILLDAFEQLAKPIEYYALDLSLNELRRTLSAVPADVFQHVKVFGLHGTYDDGLDWLRSPAVSAKPKTVLTMGSSIGNFSRPEAPKFLKSFAKALNPGDLMLVGIDACKDPEKVYHAYNDKKGVTHRFVLNGLVHANRLLGREVFKLDDWRVVGEYDEAAGRHQAFASPNKDVVFDDSTIIRKDERVRIEESYKFSADETIQLWESAGLAEGASWFNKLGDYGLHLVSIPTFHFPPDPVSYASHPVPTMHDWESLWSAWDTVTRGMIPDTELLEKPIKLRNACIFYLGHIPTFLDMHLTRSTGAPATEPHSYPSIFERGIDPDVDNPELCHAHSDIPDTWPPLAEILAFQARVRARVRFLYRTGAAQASPGSVGRALWLGFEHEVMHLETLLYMLVQSARTLAPAGVVPPDFEAMAGAAKRAAAPNRWFEIPAQEVVLGMDDPEEDGGPDRFFGWDNEKPARRAQVAAFAAKARPITNGEYAEYLLRTKREARLPASWTTEVGKVAVNGYDDDASSKAAPPINPSAAAAAAVNAVDAYVRGKFVRSVFGAVPLALALDWPVAASYDELAGCAAWMGGRIPSIEEARSMYVHAERLKAKDVAKAVVVTIPAVNSHLSNDGVEETPPSERAHRPSSPAPHHSPEAQGAGLFRDLRSVNVGFRHWHPVPVTAAGGALAGHAELGGVWEWTSSPLAPHAGFAPMPAYPGYTADFFDGKHNVVLGGSWATHPRIAGRASFVNWYQRNYPYVWAGARLVRDLPIPTEEKD
ncbi:C-type lectin protein [Lineolata rhizophorae]|uniref:C-type lectin protein n=1 Tax=Lineolata rhizophorae TaxID=578093 RepID=A0A6A6P4W1_9PEZI|nr:C-type lectin protein [Lineolata rhizophorae]